MKLNFYFTAVFFICLALFSLNCKKAKSEKGTLKGTIFLNECGSVGIDVDGAVGTGGGTAWSGHANAVTAINYCLIYDKKLAVGDAISFDVSATNVEPGSNCPYPECFMAVKSPASQVYIYNVEKL